MGKKQRRTKWRRLSLGDASGPEEEDDETQPQQQQQSVENHIEPIDSSNTLPTTTPTTTTTPEIEKEDKDERGSSPTSLSSTSSRIEMPGEQQQQQQRQWSKPLGAKQAPSGGGAYCPASRPPPTNNSFRRPRYNNNNSSTTGSHQNSSYGRANSWNSYDSHGKTHGIEKKIFNDEEYTKITTPRQEVLFKKGSIGAKKRVPTANPAGVATADGHAADSGSEHDSGNASSASPTSPGVLLLNTDAESFHYSGNDNGSTGDASSTAGDAVDGCALAAGYDATSGAPLVCFPMYDFYGGYPGMYPGGMLVQTYPGGPLVPAVPVPVPVQALDWYGNRSASATGSTNASSAGQSPAGAGEMGFYYALGYPAPGPADVTPAETGSSSRRNSLESCQASTGEASEGSPSENGSSGPSSQGPASPQSELANGSPEKLGQNGAPSTVVAAAAATVMDMAMEQRKQQQQQLPTVAGFLYPYPAYGLAPPLFADPVTGALYYDDYGYPYDYEGAAYDAETSEEIVCNEDLGTKQMEAVNEPRPAAADEKPSPAPSGATEAPSKRKTDRSADANKKKKKKKKKKKRNNQAANLNEAKAPATDEPPVEDEEEEDDEDEEVASVAATECQTVASEPSLTSSEVNSSPEPSEQAPIILLEPTEPVEVIAKEEPNDELVQEQSEVVLNVVVDELIAAAAEEPEVEPAEVVQCADESFRDSFAQEAAHVVEDIVKACETEEEEEEHQTEKAAVERDSGLIDSPLVSALEKIIAELVDAQLPSCRNDPSPEPQLVDDTAAVDDFVVMPEKDDEYFEDEMSGIGEDPPPPPLPTQPPPPPAQLWQTIVLDEPDTFQCKDDVYDLGASVEERSDSGIGKDLVPSPTTTTTTTISLGPITTAVSLWLETDPQEKLIQSTDALELVDVDSSDEEEEEEEVEVVPVTVTGPKNVQATLRCAPSSDNEQRRVDDEGEADEEPEVMNALTPQCHPAKYSVYYQLGVSVDENDNGDDDDSSKKQQQHLDDSTRSTLPLAKKKLRSSKRLSWRRRSRDAESKQHNKRLKPARSCCAVQ